MKGNKYNKWIALSLVVAISIFSFTGCIFDSKDKEDKKNTAEEPKKVEVDYTPYYQEIEYAINGLKNGYTWEEQKTVDLSVRFLMNKDYEELGYTMRDIDGNGVDELIFGCNATTNPEWGNHIYDVFTIKDGQLVHLLDGWERCIYWLCDDGTIFCRGSGGGGYYGYYYYDYKDGVMTQKESVNKERYVWYYSNDRKPAYYNGRTSALGDLNYVGNKVEISEEQANSIIDSYNNKIVFIQYTPFIKK